jgi:NADPH2:quinone reductase
MSAEQLFDAMVVRAHGGPEALVLDRVAVPPPGPGEVAIDVAAAGLNFPDLLVISGKYQTLPPCPFIPGKEVAGRIAALGADVRGLTVGQRVMAQVEHGGYSTRVRAPATTTWGIPDSVSFQTAAAMGLVYQTAHFALVARGQLRAGERVLVTAAAGGVGLAAVQLAKAFGATVLAGIRNPARADLLRANGADHIIDLSAPDLRDSLRAQVHAATGGHGVDLVIDQVGSDVFDAALRALAWCGRLVVVGFVGGRIPAARANYLLVKNIAVMGLQWSDYRDRDPAWVARVQDELFALIAAGRIAPVIDTVYPLGAAAEGLRRLEAGQVGGKLVLDTTKLQA